VGHTASDQLETLLMRLVRGTGLEGLGGIPQRRDNIIRPLLGFKRQEILAYLQAHNVAFALDPSNAKRARGLLRQAVIPTLIGLNPQAEKHAVKLAERARTDEAYLQQVAQAELQRRLGVLDSLSILAFDALHVAIATRVLRLWLQRHALDQGSAEVDKLRQIINDLSGVAISGHELRCECDALWVQKRFSYEYHLTEESSSTICISPLHLELRGEITTTTSSCTDTEDTVFFDAEALPLGLQVRPWQRGDSFQPLGFNGHTKVSDLFTNKKIPRALRAAWPLVVSGADILWVVGLRRANCAAITGSTQRILKVKSDVIWGGRSASRAF
jgi:tRNA(Ile)-lysidine synthase